MTASYGSTMRGGPSVGHGVQHAGSEAFQSDRPPSARTAPARSSYASNSATGNRGATNIRLAGTNRSGMGSGPSRFGNAGLFAHTDIGGGSFANAGLAGFGHGNSFSGGSRFGGGSGFGHSGYGGGYGHGWTGSYSHGGYGHYGYGHYGDGHAWGYGRGWGYGWGPGWGRGHGWGWGWGGDGWWFLDDLFGLALNVTSYALNPWSPFATLGADLIGDGVQALGNLNNNNNNGNYGDSYGVYANDPSYYDNSNYTYPPYRQPYQPLCGTDYSTENPGCVQ